MVSAIGSLGGHASVQRRTPELAHLEKQLSDCVHCESAKTSQGQTEIALLNARIDAIREGQSAAERQAKAQAAPAAAPQDGSLGTRLDTYA